MHRPGCVRVTTYPMCTILIVDDSVDTAEMYALGLLHAGYRPLTASNVESAQCSVKLDRPHAIVTDLNLPDCGGWALIAGPESGSSYLRHPGRCADRSE